MNRSSTIRRARAVASETLLPADEHAERPALQSDNTRRQVASKALPDGDTLTPAQKALHNNFLDSVRVLKKGLVRTIYYLRVVLDHRIHVTLGFRRISDYANHYAGLSTRQTQEFIHLGRRLPELPAVARALDGGELSWSQAREICRHADPEEQQRWIDLARSVSRQELRERLRQPGGHQAVAPDSQASGEPDTTQSTEESEPQMMGRQSQAHSSSRNYPLARSSAKRSQIAPAPPGATGVVPEAPDHCHVLLKFTPEEYARWEALLARARSVRQPKAPKGTREEILLEGIAAMAAGGGHQAEYPHGASNRPLREAGPSQETPYLLVILKCPTCDNGRIVTSRGEAPAPRSLMAAANCDAILEDAEGRRRRTVSPRRRRLALQRARYRCEAAGCRNTRFLEIHHRKPRSGGGNNELANIIVLCSRCHSTLHECEEEMRAEITRAESAADALAPGRIDKI